MKNFHKNAVLYAFAAFCAVLLVLLVVVNAKARADSSRLLRESIKSQLLAICYAARDNLDPALVDGYRLEREQADDPAYAATLERLRTLAERVGAKFIYVLKMDGGRCRFVFDTDPDVEPFGEYELFPVHKTAFEGHASADIMNLVDEWGSFHTGAVPLRRNGRVIAVVSADIEDRLIQEEMAVNRFNNALLVFTVLTVMLGMGAILFRQMRRIKTMQDALRQMAHYDPVTGLPNRQYLIDHLETLSDRGDRTPYALFFTDLDNFKTVNDKAGHDAGDALLKRIGNYLGHTTALAERRSEVYRPAAGRLTVAARIGGDEFVLLVPGVDTREEAARIAQAILDEFHQTVIDEHIRKYSVGLSIGAALFPSQSEDYHVILRYADIAMYHAKNAGKDGYRVYEDEMPDKREK